MLEFFDVEVELFSHTQFSLLCYCLAIFIAELSHVYCLFSYNPFQTQIIANHHSILVSFSERLRPDATVSLQDQDDGKSCNTFSNNF